jgi:hypothetical protein
LRGSVRVVGLVGMGQHAIRERRFNGAAQKVGADDGGNLFAAISTGKLDRRASRRKIRPRNHGGQGVEDVLLGFLDHFVRQRAATGFAHIGAELGHHRAEDVGGHRKSARKCGSRNHPARALQQAAPRQG